MKGSRLDQGPGSWGGLPATGLALMSPYPSLFSRHYLAPCYCPSSP